MSVKAQFPEEISFEGEFVRQEDLFRGWVSADGRSEYPVVAGRYHLYVSYACPWAHRTIIVRMLRGLEDAIGMTVVDPIRDERGWAFRDGPHHTKDPINGFAFLSQAYLASDPAYRQRVTVPVLWDKQTKRIVNNSEDDIMRMFEIDFEPLANNKIDLYPVEHRQGIDELNRQIYESVNNGVYRAGFATTQKAYEHAARRVFEMLDALEERLASRRYLFGPRPVETDWRLFVTLVRFDAVYVGHFKCNLRRIYDYPNLFGYLKDLYQIPGVADTVFFDHIKRHYYVTHDDINPTRIVPIGPLQDLTSPHGRAHLGSSAVLVEDESNAKKEVGT
ncbi:MAG: glutathione S-transferase family protein [Candidatus Eremiobacteraeota bacterium]|nr:glutathione S-transferase family protein [Candidatus Eremiobacteraeota bacterium]MBV8339150.1 glutathione S-transferase family protein [Candidatus Eremiobacteraeota bacterium]MBV8668262.1 glutathione S-transferase family protein [Candidatus Eremiobacteraeota bacterium]MBV8670608.1 glutathione S-transferase family protein [Candidatus Eremiobacteraeota bacterium]